MPAVFSSPWWLGLTVVMARQVLDEPVYLLRQKPENRTGNLTLPEQPSQPEPPPFPPASHSLPPSKLDRKGRDIFNNFVRSSAVQSSFLAAALKRGSGRAPI